MSSAPGVDHLERWTHLDVRSLRQPAALIFNPRAGQKLGVETNAGGVDKVQDALRSEGVAFDTWPTERAGHATDLARRAVEDGRQLVIGAGGDGTINEIARGLAQSETVLGLMPLGSIMNVARTLWVPRDLALAARTIVEGKVLAMDMGSVGDRYFLEAAGIGLDAGLFGYFDRLDRGGSLINVARAVWRFLRLLGSPRVTVEYPGGIIRSRAPMVSVANGPYVGAAYAIAPNARIDDGLLDVIVFRRSSIPRVLLHLALVAGGRPLPPPKEARLLREPWVRVSRRHGRPLPVALRRQPDRGHAGRDAFGAGRTARDHRSAIGIRHSCLGGRRAGRGGNLETAKLNLLESAPKTAHPLTNPTFRELWLANIVSNIGTWMQTVGGAWLMTTLTADALPVALMQTATALPGFLVGLPAGLADRLDRRHLTLATQAWMMACAAILGFLTLAGQVTPWLLLGMTFVLGLGNALAAPTWAAIIPDVVDRPQVPTAISMNSAGYNVARASGPALGGFVVAAVGPAYAFFVNAGSFLATLGVVFRWRPRVARVGSASGEPFTSMVLAGLKYVWQVEAQRVVLVRSMLWMLCAGAFWGLLPVVARRELELEATGYGFLVTCVGVGAVGGAFALPWLRRRVATNRLLMLAIVIFTVMYLVLAWVRFLPVICVVLAIGGAAWTTSNQNFQIAVQMSAPRRMAARAIAAYLLTFQGGQAIGAALWGAIADQVGDPIALTLAAIGTSAGLLAAAKWVVKDQPLSST